MPLRPNAALPTSCIISAIMVCFLAQLYATPTSLMSLPMSFDLNPKFLASVKISSSDTLHEGNA
ncbi:hypothetical protein PF005_g18264 [Phytophthora fragariae]|uniref:Uncharacterized protein n=1 Tax=Phytophthora fragariae TaxID=53985 RepID=A0A6A3EEJ9_9STRA|nr:hypothetical protein PF003_g36161 [Phytophthora fragariae]KAE8930271.1 hypothetical protein PF009_g19629 [Phytophthora fragariae]KAE8994877.1 hypothetical protein PF011_g16566 [Phytophthora fragariae]KAE9103364.1 hypothetical protein PF007_g14426 [Phytophthora fragariae]KAE9113368.1 hypothetical protein PF010_g10107 [Phytophthora fragariae]